MARQRDLNLAKYNISTYAYRELKNFCMQYREKKERLRELRDLSGVPCSGMPRGNVVCDPTSVKAEQALKLEDDIRMMQQTAMQVEPEEYQLLLLGITEEVKGKFASAMGGSLNTILEYRPQIEKVARESAKQATQETKEGLGDKLDVFFATGKITQAQYEDLTAKLPKESTPEVSF